MTASQPRFEQEQFADVGRGVRLCYQQVTNGDEDAPTVVLVMGLGLDMLWWRDDFCLRLCERGFRVVRFDNRDVGRSTQLRGPGVSGLGFIRRRATASYTLGDMADDVGALIASLDTRGAHVAGVSLGSFIAQETAIRHPGKVLSLTSIMGRPGDGRTGRVAMRMVPEFLRRGPADLDGAVEHLVKSFRRIGSEGRTQADDDDVRATMRASMRRDGTDGTGAGRQLAAILTERDRTADLGSLDMPVLVVHGRRDRVVLPSGGRATASAAGGAELIEVDGMGHDLAQCTWPVVIDAIERIASSCVTRLRARDRRSWRPTAAPAGEASRDRR